jgi:hypothetical protein
MKYRSRVSRVYRSLGYYRNDSEEGHEAYWKTGIVLAVVEVGKLRSAHYEM